MIARRLTSEFLGTAFLLAAVVGSGIMGERLAGGNVAIALLANTIATGAALVVLISLFGPISGAHFNPAVTLFFALRREIGPGLGTLYAAAQIAGAIAGVFAAHAMFAMPILEVSHKLRDGPAQWWSEFVATFGLLITIAGAVRICPGVRAGACRALHHGRLLVYRFDFVRQSGRSTGTVHDRQFCGHRAALPARLHRGAVRGDGGGLCFRKVAVSHLNLERHKKGPAAFSDDRLQLTTAEVIGA